MFLFKVTFGQNEVTSNLMKELHSLRSCTWVKCWLSIIDGHIDNIASDAWKSMNKAESKNIFKINYLH